VKSRIVRVVTLTVASAFAVCGGVALAALAGGPRNEFVGVLLIFPALIIGTMGVAPGFLFRVMEGYPVLTWAGVATVYLLPAGAFWLATPRLGQTGSRSGK
jgi:hypothetical protein